MTQNVVIAEFGREENAKEALRRIRNASSTNGYEVYQAAVVTKDGEETVMKESFTTGTLNRSHIASDTAAGAVLGILFGLQGFLLGALAGMILGTIYDSRQLARDQKLIHQASLTVQKGQPSLIVVANEKYEDALDQKLHACNGNIHRAYTGDLREDLHHHRTVGITMN